MALHPTPTGGAMGTTPYTHVRLLVSRESVSEAVRVFITLGLVGALFACLHHAIQPPTPPTGLPSGIVFLP